jgi:hypothetical protein
MTLPAVVFVPLAMNQSRFYAGVAEALREGGPATAFIPFHEGSVAYLRARAFDAVDIYATIRPLGQVPDDAFRLAAQRYGIDDANTLLSHEQVAYALPDRRAPGKKLAAYLEAMDRVLASLRERSGSLVVVQELGGFVPVLAAFFAARALGLDTIFIEPSFFRGRVFFTVNSLAAPSVEARLHGVVVRSEVRQYLEETVRERRIVIPAKDVGHFRGPLRKILSPYNLRRFVEKTVEKYVLHRQEEFSHLRMQVVRHGRMALNERRLRRFYRGLSPDAPFVYYPLHVFTDVALTIRAPEYLDQYWLLDYLARSLPLTHLLAVKEHPAMVGGVDYARLKQLLRRHHNLVLLDPATNNLDVIRQAAVVVTVNSKSGAETILLNRPVVALGDSFYRHSGLVINVTAPADLPAALRQALRAPSHPREAIEAFFQAVWDASYPGELYDATPENCAVFAESLVTYLRHREARRADLTPAEPHARPSL